MKVITGYLYHIKDEFFDKINAKSVMINHKNGHSRPSYLAIKDGKILWFIPLSSKIQKYQKIVNRKIKEIAGNKEAILIQNAFPTLEKYIQNRHTINGKVVKVPSAVCKEILNNFKYMLSLKENGLNLFFTDIDSIKSQLLKELQ